MIGASAIKKGLANVKSSTYFIGRWMIMGQKPLIIFDSAHNEGGIKELVAQIKKIKFNQLHFVYGTVADKDISHILSILIKKANYYFCKPNIPRGKEVEDLVREAITHKLKGDAYPSAKKAYKAAISMASKDDLVIVSGSIFVVAEVI
jgi:dihydrofolate synthase/folylpolyglutamate synthase